MKCVLFSIAVFLTLALGQASQKLTCKSPPADIPMDWKTMVPPCTQKLSEQVQEELKAAMTYLAMGAYFASDSVNRPGFSNLFFRMASEKREHTMKILEYLSLRGELTDNIGKLIKDPAAVKIEWKDGVTALREALILEASVTSKIKGILEVCEEPPSDPAPDKPFNDFHLVDYFTSEFLDEQYKVERQLAGYISNLDKLMNSHGPIGEFLFDKKLLDGELFVI